MTADERRTAIVTGGAGRIAVAAARQLGTDYRIILADLPATRLHDAADELAAAGVTVIPQYCDVTNKDDVLQLVARAVALGDIRAVVHTAGLSPAAGDARRILEVNFAGTLHLLDAVEAHVCVGTVGVCVASMSGHRRLADEFETILSKPDALARLNSRGVEELGPGHAYAISKRGVMVLCQSRASRWGERGGRLISVSPGLIGDTDMGSRAMEGYARQYVEWSALGRPGRSDEVAALIAFLCSDKASFITGCDIEIDGGMLAMIERGLDNRDRAAWHAHDS